MNKKLIPVLLVVSVAGCATTTPVDIGGTSTQLEARQLGQAHQRVCHGIASIADINTVIKCTKWQVD